MKNYSFKTKQNSRPNSEGRRTLLLVLLSIGGALLIVFFFRGFIASMVSVPSTVLIKTRDYFENSAAVLPTYLRSKEVLQRQIDALHEEVASHSGDVGTIALLQSENNELRTLLGRSPSERLLASVIARPPQTPYDVLVLDRGSRDGILEGAVVFHALDHAVGMVLRVYETVSLVMLFSSPDSESTVYVYGPNILARAYGEGGGVIRVSVPQGVVIEEGDPVVLPTIDGGVLGVIERVVSVPTEPEQNAYLTSGVPIQSLRALGVSTRIPSVPPFEDLGEYMKRVEGLLVLDDALIASSTIQSSTTPSLGGNTSTSTE